MKLNLFKKEKRQTLEEILIHGGVLTNSVSKAQALNIPALSACVELISSTIASLPINLYRETEGTTEIVKDSRTNLLNLDTKDLLNGHELKKAMVEDFLLQGGGYTFINRSGNNTKSLHFIENMHVAVNMNADPIFKKAAIQVGGAPYREFQFIKLLRKSKDGVTGKGIIKENNVMLSVAYNQLVYEEILLKTGGNKKGFLKTQNRLSDTALAELKKGWKDLYSSSNENVLILNNGLEFQEASQTSVEMQLNEHKRSNSDEICKLFLVPPNILTGEAGEEEYNNFIKVCILPILAAFETALNKDLLLPSEKENLYFAFDTTELTKASIEERFAAYDIGIRGGFMQVDEVRFKENLPPLKLKFVKLGLQDVLYFPDSEEIYTPNTNKLAKMGEEPEESESILEKDGEDNETVPNNTGFGATPNESEDNGEAK